MKPVFGILAVLFNLVGYIPYIYDIIRHKVRPQRVTWAIWTILTSVIFVNQVVNGGGWSSWFFGSTTLLVTLTFVLSIKRGMGGASKTDKVTLAAAAVLLAYWITVHDTRLSTVIALCIDAIAAVPTIIKTRKKPATESYPQWVLAGIGGLFSLLAVGQPSIILLLYPLYVVLMNATIVATKYYAERIAVQ